MRQLITAERVFTAESGRELIADGGVLIDALLGIEIRGGLVHQDDLGIHGKGAHDRQPLDIRRVL